MLDADARTARANREAFAEIRALAFACGAVLDAQFRQTFVLAPNDLWLTFDTPDDGLQVNVTPTFRDAPEAWRGAFRRWARVPRTGIYKFTGDHGEHVEVVLREPVRAFLSSFRERFPNATATGPSGRALLENPVALFGHHGAVLNVERTEEALAELRRGLWTFTPQVDPSDGRPVERVGLLLTPTDAEREERPRVVWFVSARRLRQFVADVRQALATATPVIDVFDHPVELSDRDERTIDSLDQLAEAWEQRRAAAAARPHADVAADRSGDGTVLIDTAWVFDLSKYADRVDSIGIDLPFGIAQISLSRSGGWLPDDQEFEVLISFAGRDGGGRDGGGAQLRISSTQLDALAERCQTAEQHGEDEVELPGGRSLPLEQAKELVEAVPMGMRPSTEPSSTSEHDAQSPQSEGAPTQSRTAPSSTRTNAGESVGLLYKANIDRTDYRPGRAIDVDHRPSEEPRLPSSLRPGVVLREHQRRGVAWLQSLLARAPHHCRGALLADDMGLGKTLQLLTVIARAHEDVPEHPASLVIAPVSLLDNWEREIERFFEPGAIRVQRLAGAHLAPHKVEQHEIAPELLEQRMTRFLRPGWRDERTTLVLTTYQTLRDYAFSFSVLDWSIVVCDEAQYIKNPNAMRARAVKRLRATFCIAATGTPVENNLTDLWSIYDFVQPGLLEPLNEFNQRYRRPIETRGERDEARLGELVATIAPQLMRRVKEDVLDALPEKRRDHECLSIPMSPVQRKHYREAVRAYRLAPPDRRRGEMLTLLHRLKGISADPLVGDELASGRFPALEAHRHASAKLDWLLATLERIRAREEKAIVFTERRDLQRLLKHYIDQYFGLNVFIVNGGTKAYGDDGRQSRIDEFQAAPGFNVIILSQMATGVGLNIQQANHVIHYTRHWNPAKEDQATDRAYRIGQERDVIVYTPIVTLEGIATFEQRLDELLEEKRQLARDVLNGCDDVSTEEVFEALKSDLDSFEPEASRT